MLFKLALSLQPHIHREQQNLNPSHHLDTTDLQEDTVPAEEAEELLTIHQVGHFFLTTNFTSQIQVTGNTSLILILMRNLLNIIPILIYPLKQNLLLTLPLQIRLKSLLQKQQANQNLPQKDIVLVLSLAVYRHLRIRPPGN